MEEWATVRLAVELTEPSYLDKVLLTNALSSDVLRFRPLYHNTPDTVQISQTPGLFSEMLWSFPFCSNCLWEQLSQQICSSKLHKSSRSFLYCPPERNHINQLLFPHFLNKGNLFSFAFSSSNTRIKTKTSVIQKKAKHTGTF